MKSKEIYPFPILNFLINSCEYLCSAVVVMASDQIFSLLLRPTRNNRRRHSPDPESQSRSKGTFFYRHGLLKASSFRPSMSSPYKRHRGSRQIPSCPPRPYEPHGCRFHALWNSHPSPLCLQAAQALQGLTHPLLQQRPCPRGPECMYKNHESRLTHSIRTCLMSAFPFPLRQDAQMY